jgi:hypothetical protein
LSFDDRSRDEFNLVIARACEVVVGLALVEIVEQRLPTGFRVFDREKRCELRFQELPRRWIEPLQILLDVAELPQLLRNLREALIEIAETGAGRRRHRKQIAQLVDAWKFFAVHRRSLLYVGLRVPFDAAPGDDARQYLVMPPARRGSCNR